MTVTPNVSFIGQALAQSTRLGNMRVQLDDLQRQISTQKKHEDIGGFGGNAGQIVRLHASTNILQSHLNNIDTARTRIKAMTGVMQKAIDAARQMKSQIVLQQANNSTDMSVTNTLGTQLQELLRDVLNYDIDGRYLFAGSRSQTLPVSDLPTLNTNNQTEVTQWLSGAITTQQLTDNVDAFTTSQLGFDATLATSGSVTAHIDTSLEVDYTVIADSSGMDKLMRAFGLAANLTFPNPATDVPDATDVQAVLDYIDDLLKDGAAEAEASVQELGGQLTLMESIQQNHQQDLQIFQLQIDRMENADTTEAIAKLQILQTQLSASYQVTNIVSQLSLVNFL